MTTSPKSRSVQATSEGLEKVRTRMAELEKPGNINKKGWTQENLADKSGVSISTVKRFLKGESIDRPNVIWITGALNLDPLEVVDAKEWNQDTGNLEIDWRLVCHTKLEKQQEEQRIRRKASKMGFELNVHVPLGLVERKHQQRRDENVERGQVYQLGKEVITKTYKHQEFLQQVISQRPAGKNKQIAIVGEPGAGKTTLLNAIAISIKSHPEELPIFISLGSLQGMTLKDYLLKKWLPDAIKLVNPQFVITREIENQLETRLYKLGVWLLLDGVDEMGESSPIEALNKISKELTNWLGQAWVILTCRLNVWDTSLNNNILPGFDTYKTQEFKAEQVDEFIYEWFTHAKSIQQGEELKAKLKQPGKERICELVTNPLRLVLLCQIFYLDKHGELPETKAGLFEFYTRHFYHWKAELFQELINSYELQQELHQALGKLALAGINNDSRFRLRESLAIQEMGERLFKFACGVGWLNLVDRDAANDEAVYAFFHPNFQEYFAALVIDDWHYFLNHNNQNPNPLIQHNNQDCVYRIFEPQWKEVFLLWLGQDNDKEFTQNKEALIKEMLDFRDDCGEGNFYGYRAYFLAALGIAQFRECSESNSILNQLIEWAFDNNNSTIRKIIKLILWETDRIKVIKQLNLRLISSQYKSTNYEIAIFLQQINPENQEAITVINNEKQDRLATIRNRELFQEGSFLTLDQMQQYWKHLDQMYQNESIWRKNNNVIWEPIEGEELIEKIIRLKYKLMDEDLEETLNVCGIDYYEFFWDDGWYCAHNMSYPEFYRAWHGDSSPLQSLETQFTDIDSVLFQLQTTDKTSPLVINLETLQDETDTSAVSQEICNQIYFTAFTKYIEIPEVNNAPQLKRIIPQIKENLQRENIALIINCEPNQAIITFSRKLTDVLHIAFITDKPLDAPLKGFPLKQKNLLSAIQSWINEIG